SQCFLHGTVSRIQDVESITKGRETVKVKNGWWLASSAQAWGQMSRVCMAATKIKVSVYRSWNPGWKAGMSGQEAEAFENLPYGEKWSWALCRNVGERP